MMDVSAEAADLVVKESLQATESAAKLLGSGMKNVAALLLALARDDYKVVGKTNSKRLARDPAPAEVIRIKKEDMGKFQKLAKEFGVLFFFAQKKGNESGYVNVVSSQNYVPQLNAVMEALGYPIPQQAQAKEETPKKAMARAPQEKSSKERGTGSTPSETAEQKPSVRKRLEYLKSVSEQTRSGPEKIKEKTR